MTQPVKPIRAWATYDKWMWMADRDDDGRWRVFAMPLTGEGEEFVTGLRSIAYTVERLAYMLPLRSLRVLFDNGHELHVSDEGGRQWYWYIDAPQYGPGASGHFYEDTDHEAVERAMIAAAAVFNPTYTPE